MVLFALLMLVIGSMMLLQRRKETPERETADAPEQHNLWLTLASGSGVGLLTGILRVGGGSLIVPALVIYALRKADAKDIHFLTDFRGRA